MMGNILQELGQNEDAIQNFKIFLELWKDSDPDLPEKTNAQKQLSFLQF